MHALKGNTSQLSPSEANSFRLCNKYGKPLLSNTDNKFKYGIRLKSRTAEQISYLLLYFSAQYLSG